MKSRWMSGLILFAILFACVAGVFWLMKQGKTSKTFEPVAEVPTGEIRYTVKRGYLQSNLVLEGIAVNRNENEYVYLCEKLEEGETPEIKTSPYSEVHVGDELFSIAGTKHLSPVNGILAKSHVSETMIECWLFDYDSIYIETAVNYALLDKIPVGAEIAISEVNSLRADSESKESVLSHGFLVENDCVDVCLTNSKHLWPGTRVRITMQYQNDRLSCYVLKRMILQDGGGAFVYVKEGEKRIRRDVILGQVFVAYDTDDATEFVEVLEGLSEGEVLVIDVFE